MQKKFEYLIKTYSDDLWNNVQYFDSKSKSQKKNTLVFILWMKVVALIPQYVSLSESGQSEI